MCGIIRYVGHRRPQEVQLEGLRRLEYRGYAVDADARNIAKTVTVE